MYIYNGQVGMLCVWGKNFWRSSTNNGLSVALLCCVYFDSCEPCQGVPCAGHWIPLKIVNTEGLKLYGRDVLINP